MGHRVERRTTARVVTVVRALRALRVVSRQAVGVRSRKRAEISERFQELLTRLRTLEKSVSAQRVKSKIERIRKRLSLKDFGTEALGAAVQEEELSRCAFDVFLDTPVLACCTPQGRFTACLLPISACRLLAFGLF